MRIYIYIGIYIYIYIYTHIHTRRDNHVKRDQMKRRTHEGIADLVRSQVQLRLSRQARSNEALNS